MRWKRGERSENLEDRRADTGGRGRMPFPFPFPTGGRGRMPRGRVPLPMPRGRGPRISLGGLLFLLLLFFLLRDQLALMGPAQEQARVPSQPGAAPFPSRTGPTGSAAEEELVDFVSFVLDDLQATWAELLPGYRPAKLVLFRDAVRSGCGFAAAQMGPFYCPMDEKVYVDLAFYEELQRRFGAPGDFAQAYVLAHEIGHHVQRLAGIEPQVRDAQRSSPGQANELSVRMELQADCLAGVWGRAAAGRGILEPGDVEEGLRAAGAIGDDRIQRQQAGYVQPEGFTHGSSQQRQRWLQRGLETGDPDACDTFEVASP